MQFFGKINKQGVLSIIDAHFPKYVQFLMTLTNKDIEIVVRKRRKMSTKKQRSYYWGAMLPQIGRHTGYNPDSLNDMKSLHEALKMMFLCYQDEKTGLTMTRSTEDLSTVEKNDYHKKITEWAMDFHGFIVTPPEHNDDFEFYYPGESAEQKQFV